MHNQMYTQNYKNQEISHLDREINLILCDSTKFVSRTFTNTQLLVLDHLIEHIVRYKGVCWLSQKTIAKRLGYTRESVNRAIAFLANKLEILIKVRRPYCSSLYSLPSWLTSTKVAKALKEFFPSLAYFCIAGLSISLLSCDRNNPQGKCHKRGESILLSKVDTRECKTKSPLSIPPAVVIQGPHKTSDQQSEEVFGDTSTVLSKQSALYEQCNRVSDQIPVSHSCKYIETVTEKNKKEDVLVQFGNEGKIVVEEALFDFEFCGVRLTPAGMIEMSGYPREAVIAAKENLKRSKEVKDPYKLLHWLCRKYCKDKKLWIDYEKIEVMKREAGGIQDTEERVKPVEHQGQTNSSFDIAQGRSNKRQGNSNKGEIQGDRFLAVYFTPEEVRRNIDAYNRNRKSLSGNMRLHNLLPDIEPLFTEELEKGEHKKISRRSIVRRRGADGSDEDLIAWFKNESGLTQTKEEEEGNGITQPRSESFNQFEPRAQKGMSHDSGVPGDDSGVSVLSPGGSSQMVQSRVEQELQVLRYTKESEDVTQAGASKSVGKEAGLSCQQSPFLDGSVLYEDSQDFSGENQLHVWEVP
jgi:CRP-like cAMP-binding protein